MPVTYKIVNGRMVSVGTLSDEERRGTDTPPARPPRRVGKPKPKPPPPPWWSGLFALGRLANDVTYEARLLKQRGPTKYAARALANVGREMLAPAPRRSAGGAEIAATAAVNTVGVLLPPPIRRQALLAGAGIGHNAMLLADGIRQQVMGPRRQAPFIDGLVDTAYRALGAIPPSEMSRADYEKDQARRNLGVMALSAAPGVGQAAGATTLAGAVIRGGATFALGEAIGTYLSDNRGGNIVDLINGLTEGKLPGAVGANADYLTAANRSVIPNAVASAGVGATVGLVARGLGGLKNTVKAARDARAKARVEGNRAELASSGQVTVDPESGTASFPQAVQDELTRQQADAAARQKVADWIKGTSEAAQAKAAAEVPGIALQKPPPPPSPVPTRPAAGFEDFGKAQPAPLPPPQNPALDPWLDDPQYQDRLRRNASRAIVPVQGEAPPPLAQLPRQPLPPRDEIRGEGLADPWGIGPDPNSPVQQALGRKAGVAPSSDPVREYLRLRQGEEAMPAAGPAAAQPDPAVKEPLTPPAEKPQAAQPDPAAEKSSVAPAKEPQAAQSEAGGEAEAPVVYEPTLPEADSVLDAMKQLSDEELVALSQAEGPVVPLIEQLAGSRVPRDPETGPNPNLRADLAMAPADSVDEEVVKNYPYYLRSMGEDQLRDLTDPSLNPELSQFVQDNAGKSWGELDFQDLIDGVGAWQGESGMVVVPRHYSGDFLSTKELVAGLEPETFQYKGGTDARGVQKGGSLEGVTRWNPSLEGIVEVWRNPATGKVSPVNGHNRVNAADDLSIGSLPVRYLVAGDAANARAQGAAANIATGSGTVFDAAKFLRETGLTTKAQVESLGMPLASGKTEAGLALARLPADIFRDAQDGLLDLDMAITMGRANLDEPTVRALYGMVRSNPDMTKGAFDKLVRMGQGLLEARPPAGRAGGQGTIPGMGELLSNLRPKAELMDAIEQGLRKQRTVMNRTAKEAERLTRVGNQIDVGSTKAAGAEASDLLTIFQRDQLLAGPLSDLLNLGAEEIASGAKVGPVADRIAKQFKDMVAAGVEGTPAVDPNQGALFGPLPGAAEAPADPGLVAARQADIAQRAKERPPLVDTTMPEELRAEIRRAAMDRAIAQEEVRPPEAPIPNMPEPPMHSLPAAAKALRDAGDTRGKGVFYHGAADEFSLEPGGEYGGDGMNIYGDGFYATDDLAIARKYQKKNRKSAPAEASPLVYQVVENKPVKFFDLDEPVPAFIIKKLRNSVVRDAKELFDVAVEEAGDGASLGQIMDEMRGLSRGYNMPAHEVQDIFHNFATTLEKAGYGGFTHVGGNQSGGGKRNHQVRIYWNPSETISIKKADPPAVDPGSPAAQVLADELRLAAENMKRDAAIDWEIEKAARDASDRELLTFDDLQATGEISDGFDKPPSVADAFDQAAAAMAKSDAQVYRRLGKGLDEIKARVAQLDEAGTPPVAPEKPEPAQLVDGPPDGPSLIGAKLTEAQERAVFEIAKVTGDGPEVLRRLREGGMPSDRAAQLVADFRKMEGTMDGKMLRSARAAVRKIEEAMGVPSAVKQAVADAESQIAAKTKQAEEIRRKAAEEGC